MDNRSLNTELISVVFVQMTVHIKCSIEADVMMPDFTDPETKRSLLTLIELGFIRQTSSPPYIAFFFSPGMEIRPYQLGGTLPHFVVCNGVCQG